MSWWSLFSTPLDPERLQWVLEHWEWLDRNGHPPPAWQRSALVLPTQEGFPITATDPGGRIVEAFERVRDSMGMWTWPFRLTPVEGGDACGRSLEVPPGIAAPPKEAGNVLDIPFPARLALNPTALVAYFAHTLARHRLGTFTAPPGGDPEETAALAELLAVQYGFGIFLTNAAGQLRKSCCGGCQVERIGILDQQTMSLALALFCVLKEIPAKSLRPHLETNPRHYTVDFATALRKEHAARLEHLKAERPLE